MTDIYRAPPPTRRLRSRRAGTPLALAPRFWIGIFIPLFFATMMTLLWRRERGLDYTVRSLGISPDLLAATWIDYDQWMWIERGDERLGAYMIRVRRIEEQESYRLTARARLDLQIMNLSLPFKFDLEVNMTDRFELDDLRARLMAAGVAIAAEGFVEDMNLYYAIEGPELLVTGGGVTSKIELRAPVMMTHAVRPVITQTQKLEVGNSWSTRASNPLNGGFDVLLNVEVEAEETWEEGGKTKRVFRIAETLHDGPNAAKTLSWYDAQGNLLKTDLGNGLIMTAAHPREVLKLYPEMRLPMRAEPVDRDRLRLRAMQNDPLLNGETLPWWPNL